MKGFEHMKKKKYSSFEVRRRISRCKKRLRNLKIQGFTFSDDIYDDIDRIEEEIHQHTMLSQIKKRKTFIIIAIFFMLLISTIAIILFWPNEISEEKIAIDIINAFEDMEITKSLPINGTASIEETSSFKIQNLNVQFRIDNHSIENATIKIRENATNILDWSFFLDISKLNNGEHSFSVICFFNENFSNIKNITLKLDKPRPQVSITYPEDGDIDLNGKINISGFAIAEFNEIQKVNIFIDGEKNEISVFKNENWFYLWNTFEVDNGPHTISVRSYDGEKWSKNFTINFTVFNLENWILPDFEGSQIFQFVIRDIKHVMLPGINYTMYGAHRCKNEHYFLSKSIHSYLEFPNRPDWLIIYLEDNYFVTPRNGKINYFTFNISITNNAEKGVYTDEFLGWRACYGPYNFLADNCFNDLMADIWLSTGQW